MHQKSPTPSLGVDLYRHASKLFGLTGADFERSPIPGHSLRFGWSYQGAELSRLRSWLNSVYPDYRERLSPFGLKYSLVSHTPSGALRTEGESEDQAWRFHIGQALLYDRPFAGLAAGEEPHGELRYLLSSVDPKASITDRASNDAERELYRRWLEAVTQQGELRGFRNWISTLEELIVPKEERSNDS